MLTLCGKVGNKFCVMLGKNEMERKNVVAGQSTDSDLHVAAAAAVCLL